MEKTTENSLETVHTRRDTSKDDLQAIRSTTGQKKKKKKISWKCSSALTTGRKRRHCVDIYNGKAARDWHL